MAEPLDLRHWIIETDDERICWLWLDKAESPTNVLSAEVLRELSTIVDQLLTDRPKGVVFASRKSTGFIAGADISEFDTHASRNDVLTHVQSVHHLFQRIENLACPTVAMINGFCLGGGLELSLACNARVALDEPNTRIGLPEVKLGIHPGWGGVARMLKLLGPIKAMELMLSGRTIDARSARKMGLIQHAVPERYLRTAARAMVTKPPQRKALPLLDRVAGWSLARPLLKRQFEKQVAKAAQREHYPAPYAIIDLWAEHASDPVALARAEAQSVVDLLHGATAQNLIRVFRLQEMLKGLGKSEASNIKHVHVIGGGIMGGDIAIWCALRGLQVTVQDTNHESLARVMQRAGKLFKRRLKVTRNITAALDRLQPDVRGDGVARADLVIEAIFENLEAKRQLFRDIEMRLKYDAILATNTSSIPLEELTQVLVRPERLVGLHFFNPVAKMPLVEVVNATETSPAVMARAMAFTREIDRLPLPVKSSPAFLVNRVLMPYLLESVVLVAEGFSGPSIDAAAKQYGMPMGPIELADRVGLDVCLSVAELLSERLNFRVPERLHSMVAAGKLGVKSGQGFYRYADGKPRQEKRSGEQLVPSPEITDRLILRLINESVACLREGVVDSANQIDAGLIFGAGFAPFRGGPLNAAKASGIGNMLSRLTVLRDKHGDRFQPDAGWQELPADNDGH
jgi:3-hydroxyacyl-CoA dehydrogenase/enoyl-CoA hydratase/3-hydroxybutyryl-CoA epimerase